MGQFTTDAILMFEQVLLCVLVVVFLGKIKFDRGGHHQGLLYF
jgi:hypothetical protein